MAHPAEHLFRGDDIARYLANLDWAVGKPQPSPARRVRRTYST
jgi:hypothetical protein